MFRNGSSSYGASSSERVLMRLDGRGARLYYPGETLAGSCSLSEIRRQSIASVEISTLWRAESGGIEDVGVHAFWRLASSKGDWIDPLQPIRFSVLLPQSPLSYDGILFNISWRVRARVFLSNGEQFVADAPFRLGALPGARKLDDQSAQ